MDSQSPQRPISEMVKPTNTIPASKLYVKKDGSRNGDQ